MPTPRSSDKHQGERIRRDIHDNVIVPPIAGAEDRAIRKIIDHARDARWTIDPEKHASSPATDRVRSNSRGQTNSPATVRVGPDTLADPCLLVQQTGGLLVAHPHRRLAARANVSVESNGEEARSGRNERRPSDQWNLTRVGILGFRPGGVAGAARKRQRDGGEQRTNERNTAYWNIGDATEPQ